MDFLFKFRISFHEHVLKNIKLAIFLANMVGQFSKTAHFSDPKCKDL